MNIGGKARTTGTARHDSVATGEAKPRRTSGGAAASKGLLRQSVLRTLSVAQPEPQLSIFPAAAWDSGNIDSCLVERYSLLREIGPFPWRI